MITTFMALASLAPAAARWGERPGSGDRRTMARTTTPSGSGFGTVLKRVLVGRRQPTYRMEHTLLPKVLALPIFSSDALSSVAYATEEIMVVLLASSLATRHLILPISIAIAALMPIVVASYVQVCRCSPSGGAASIV